MKKTKTIINIFMLIFSGLLFEYYLFYLILIVNFDSIFKFILAVPVIILAILSLMYRNKSNGKKILLSATIILFILGTYSFSRLIISDISSYINSSSSSNVSIRYIEYYIFNCLSYCLLFLPFVAFFVYGIINFKFPTSDRVINEPIALDQNSNKEDPYEALKKIKNLFDEGILSKEEYDKIKEKHIGDLL